MIKINTVETKDTITVRCNGHAGFASKGNDIICAAVSILVETWDEYCDRMHAESVQRKKADGCFEMTVINRYGKLDKAFEFFQTGINMLEEAYPEYISVGRIKK